MARKPKKNAGIGDNNGGDDQGALLLHHLHNLRTQKVEVDKAHAIFAAERTKMNTLYRVASLDHFTRQELSELMADQTSTVRDLAVGEARRVMLRQSIGLPVGPTQLDMFTGASTPEKDASVWRSEGYLVGLRGGVGEAPVGCPGEHTQAFMEGWHDGQAHNARGLARATALKASTDINLGDEPPKVERSRGRPARVAGVQTAEAAEDTADDLTGESDHEDAQRERELETVD